MADLGAIGVGMGGSFLSRTGPGPQPTNIRGNMGGAAETNGSNSGVTVSGTTRVSGVATGGIQVLMFDSKTNVLLNSTISNGSGYFSMNAYARDSVYIMSFNGGSYQMIAFNEVIPV